MDHIVEDELKWLSSLLDDSASDLPPHLPPGNSIIPAGCTLPSEPYLAPPAFSAAMTQRTTSRALVAAKAKRSIRARRLGWWLATECSNNNQIPLPQYTRIPLPFAPRATVARRCTHCATYQTPQWRQGPEGPKTLCNACGVRYKAGRLLPEYRPKASPTYVRSLHSYSHRKVMEIRRKKEAASLADAAPEAHPPSYFLHFL
jgi:hypothetical protein